MTTTDYVRCAEDRARIATAIRGGSYHQAADQIERYVSDALTRIGVRHG